MKNTNGPSKSLDKAIDGANANDFGVNGGASDAYNPNIYHIYGHGDFQSASSLFQINCDRVDMLDEDLEDDDMDLYYKLSIPDQILLMKIRQTLQSAIINKQALCTMDYLENDLMKRIHNKREIQEAKINLIKMLSECETEEELI
jgi:hypothetical protein